MNEEKKRPYLSDRRCGRCLKPFETTERREGGWLFVSFKCPCGSSYTVTFSPAELEEWARRRLTASKKCVGRIFPGRDGQKSGFPRPEDWGGKS